jgi:hypothetical protein
VSDYVWQGESSVPVRWIEIGRIRLIPSMRYELTVMGPEYYVRTHYRLSGATGSDYARWTERIGPNRQIGGGFSLSRWTVRGVVPRLTIDLWSHTREGLGAHGEVGADVTKWPSSRAALTVAVGAKSSGYLLGFPLDSGAHITAGFNVTLW